MFSKAAEQKERCITIATSTIPAQYILPDILVKFRERFPEEQFRIVESDSSTVIEQVASHLVDIGFSGTVIEKQIVNTYRFTRMIWLLLCRIRKNIRKS